MEIVQQIVDTLAAYFQSGFYKVNAVQGLIIAAIAAYLMPGWRRLLIIALGAVVAHAVLDVMLPVLANGGAFRLPPLVEVEYWKYLLRLYAGYLIVISVLYLVKRVVLRGSH